MKHAVLTVVLVGAVCVRAGAAVSPESQKVAEELLTLTNVEANLAAVREQAKTNIAAQIQSMNIPDNMRDRSTRYQQELIDTIFDALSFAKMKTAYVDIYAATFSVDELKQVVAFYKSPSGRAYAQKMPLLLKQMNDAAQAQLQALSPRLQKMHNDFLADLKQAAAH